MSLVEIRQLVDNYYLWVRDKTTLRQVDENWTEITTPMLDRHNDHLQIYARKKNGQYILTDDGYIVADLEQSGCNLDSPRRKSLLKQTLNGFGIQMENDQLIVSAAKEDFARRKHNLLQAMLAVNDLFYLAQAHTENLFYEDVVQWLDDNDVRYTANKKVTGKSGFDHTFHFIVPKTRKYPERFVHSVTKPDRNTAQKLFGSWIDVRDAVGSEAISIAILNDSERLGTGVTKALQQYDITPLPWSKRDESIELLVA